MCRDSIQTTSKEGVVSYIQTWLIQDQAGVQIGTVCLADMHLKGSISFIIAFKLQSLSTAACSGHIVF